MQYKLQKRTRSRQTSSLYYTRSNHYAKQHWKTMTRRNVRQNEPQHDKTNKISAREAKIQISLGILLVWSESLQCAKWVAEDLRFPHANREESGQTGRMPRLIWVFAGRTAILFVLSCGGSNETTRSKKYLPKSKVACSICSYFFASQFQNFNTVNFKMH